MGCGGAYYQAWRGLTTRKCKPKRVRKGAHFEGLSARPSAGGPFTTRSAPASALDAPPSAKSAIATARLAMEAGFCFLEPGGAGEGNHGEGCALTAAWLQDAAMMGGRAAYQTKRRGGW